MLGDSSFQSICAGQIPQSPSHGAFSGVNNRKNPPKPKKPAVSRDLFLVLAVGNAKALKKVALPGEMGRKPPLVLVQTWRDPSLEDVMISAPALLHPLPFPDRESPQIDPKETFTPQFLPAGFYSQGKL